MRKSLLQFLPPPVSARVALLLAAVVFVLTRGLILHAFPIFNDEAL